MNRSLITRFATTALLSGGLGVTGLALGAGTAEAYPGWCPGQPIPMYVHWNMNVCHNYHYDNRGLVDDGTGVLYPYPNGPIPPPTPPASPAPLPPCPPSILPCL